MTTQSKSVLMPFLILAGIVFAAALAWKYLGNHDVEPEVKPAEVETTTAVKTVKPITPKAEPVAVENESFEPDFLEPVSAQVREMEKKQAQNNMKFAMRYSTLEKAIDGLKAFRENGNDQAANNLIKYINTRFPNDSIPADLLD